VHVAGHVGGGGGELGGRGFQLGEDRLGSRDEPPAGLGQPDAAALAVEQRDAGLALERGELLRDRGRREGERPRGGGDRPALRHLAQHAHAAHVERAQRRPGGRPRRTRRSSRRRRVASGFARRHRKWSLRLSIETVTCAGD